MWKRIVAGLGGAIAINMLHNFMKNKFDDVPKFKEVKHEAVDKSLEKINLQIKDEDRLQRATFAGDILSNAIYYSITPFKMTSLIGILGGFGAIVLPKKLGLDNRPIAGTDTKKIITVGYYLFGAFVANRIYKIISCKKKRHKK